MYFSHKHVKIGPNCSQEIPHFLKYRIPLKVAFTDQFSYGLGALLWA